LIYLAEIEGSGFSCGNRWHILLAYIQDEILPKTGILKDLIDTAFPFQRLRGAAAALI
jgi:hypothetical protein